MSSNNFDKFSESVAESPAKRALLTPGSPARASTSSPVSSATAGVFASAQTADALSRALPSRAYGRRRVALILGEDEVARGEVGFKHLRRDLPQESVPAGDVVGKLIAALGAEAN